MPAPNTEHRPPAPPVRASLLGCTVAAVLLGLGSPAAQAALLSHEPFDYPVTNRVQGLAGGSGWLTAWTGNNAIREGSPAPDRVASSAHSLQAVGSGTASFRSFATNGLDTLLTPQRKFGRDGTTLWLSFVMQRDNRPAGNRYLGLSLFEDGSERLFIGSPFNAEVWGFEVTAVASATRTTIPITNGVPVLLVLKLQFGTQGTRDTYSFYVNPSAGAEPPTPDAQTTGNFNFNRLRITGGEGAIRGVFDEIRLGETFADVVPGAVVPPGMPFIPASYATPTEAVNTNAPGFRIRVAQASQLGGGLANSIARAESQLEGTLIDPAIGAPYVNQALPGPDPDGSYAEEQTVNYNQTPDAFAGSFGPDRAIPGIPGTGGHTDNIALEAVTYLELPAGTNRFGVNSDDGFRLTIGVAGNPRDRTARAVGVVDAGRPAEDSIFDFYVEKAGIYPARLVWFESTGGASLEWFSVDPVTGVKALINDRTESRAIRAWREAAVPQPPYAARIEPLPDSSGNPPDAALVVGLLDGDSRVDETTIRVSLNGSSVTPAVDRAGRTTTVSFRPSQLLPAGSTNTAELIFADHATPPSQYRVAWRFQIENYGTLPSEFALPLGSHDPAQPGYRVRVHQSAVPIGPTRLGRAEDQLAGRIVDPNTDEPYPNVADLTAADPDGFFVEAATLNYSQDGSQGQEGQFKPDRLIPGIPGTTGSTDNFAAELLTYLDLPAGLHRFGVNSDDGFRVTVGRNDPRDAFGLELGVFPGDRGAGDTLFSFLAPVAGLYPFRLVWWEGSGGASLEWYAFDPVSGERYLINDQDRPGAVRAWRAVGDSAPMYVSRVEPAVGELAAGADSRLTVEFRGSPGFVGTLLDTNRTELRLDGVPVSALWQFEETRGVLTQTPGPLLAPGSSHEAILILAQVDEPLARTNSWRFTVESYPVLPIAAALVPDAVDTTAPGFRFRAVQASAFAGLANSSERAELQLGGTLIDPLSGVPYPNEAYLGPQPDGSYPISNTINFNQDGPTSAPQGDGNFRPDEAMPGIPGQTGHHDFYSTETFAWLELQAGYVRMGINSDDGFRLTLAQGPAAGAPVLAAFEGGRGPADTLFSFVVPVSGVYPFRLVHYDGDQGSSLEWFTVVGGAAGRKVLVNDRNHAAATRAWRGLSETPALRIEGIRVDAGVVEIRWSGSRGVRLERSPGLAPPVWELVPETESASVHREPLAGGPRFFRLARP